MRVIESEKSLPAIPQPLNSLSQSPEAPVDEAEAKEKRRSRRQKPQHRNTLAKFVFACLFFLAIIVASLAYLVFFVAGPLIKSVDSLPADFPKSLAFYELDQAKIKFQSPASKRQLAQLASGLPAWALEPFSAWLTTDLKTKLVAELQDPNLLPEKLSLDALGQALATGDDLTKTVGLEWGNLPKTKEELVDYYKKQLTANGYVVKEKISDYEIDLSFFKPGIDGAMSVADSFSRDNNSIIKMTINYLSK